MIAKGNTHDNGARLARYITTGKEGELAELWELRGFALRDPTEAFRTVHVIAGKGQCKQPFFHLQIRNAEGQLLTRPQWNMAVDTIEKELGLVDQPRAVAVHIDRETGHEHVHVAWSRIDPETLNAKPLPFFKLRLKRACRELETSLGLTPVSSNRNSSIRYAPKRREEQQAIRLGVALKDVRENIRAAFERSDCGRSFQSALGNEELVLARGDRRDFVAIDPAGGMHVLGKRLLGASAAEIRNRLSDLSRALLPSVEQARQSLRSGPAPQFSAVEMPAPRNTGRRRVGEANYSLPAQPVTVSQCVPPLTLNSVHCDGPAAYSSAPLAPSNQEPISAIEALAKKDPPGGLGASLRKHFRSAVRALFRRTQSPQPQSRRRRTGETVGTFRMVARSLLRPIIRVPAVSRAVGLLSDALPWLHLWEWNEMQNDDHGHNNPNANEDHFSPHP